MAEGLVRLINNTINYRQTGLFGTYQGQDRKTKSLLLLKTEQQHGKSEATLNF